MFERIKALCMRSLTMAWAYLVGLFGIVMGMVDQVATVLADPTIVQKMTETLGASPRALAAFSLIISVVTIATRTRSLLAKPKE